MKKIFMTFFAIISFAYSYSQNSEIEKTKTEITELENKLLSLKKQQASLTEIRKVNIQIEDKKNILKYLLANQIDTLTWKTLNEQLNNIRAEVGTDNFKSTVNAKLSGKLVVLCGYYKIENSSLLYYYTSEEQYVGSVYNQEPQYRTHWNSCSDLSKEVLSNIINNKWKMTEVFLTNNLKANELSKLKTQGDKQKISIEGVFDYFSDDKVYVKEWICK